MYNGDDRLERKVVGMFKGDSGRFGPRHVERLLGRGGQN